MKQNLSKTSADVTDLIFAEWATGDHFREISDGAAFSCEAGCADIDTHITICGKPGEFLMD